MPNAKLKLCVDRIILDDVAAIPFRAMDAIFSHDFAPKDVKLGVATRKKWPNGDTLNCSFLNGTEEQQRRVQKYAKRWEKYANIQLSFGSVKTADVRISFGHDETSWSAVGTDALNTAFFPKREPTMNLGWLLDGETDEREFRRVVLHEFGHALGLIHEHQQPNAALPWNREAVYQAYSGPPNNWNRQEIDQNIFVRYSQEQINSTLFDGDSIMLYHFPPELFLSGLGTPLNTELSKMDKDCIKGFYPRA